MRTTNTKPRKIKTYVLMVSQTFPAYHPRKGQPTEFPVKIGCDEKVHTVRGNYAEWKRKADEINAGIALLSVRIWTGLPYRSKQHELTQLHQVNVQRCHIYQIERPGAQAWQYETMKRKTLIFIDNKVVPLQHPFKFAYRDGLSLEDLNAWFKKPIEDAALIHFNTNFLY